jgi:adenine-specific DNA-methyltransferase
VRAFRDTWKDGIHSYLTYLRDRLTAMRDLLTESGSIFVQIGVENVHRVRAVMDEVFGDENFVSLITYSTTGGFSSAGTLSRSGDYVLWYARDVAKVKYRQLHVPKELSEAVSDDYDQVQVDGDQRRALTPEKTHRLFRAMDACLPTTIRPAKEQARRQQFSSIAAVTSTPETRTTGRRRCQMG